MSKSHNFKLVILGDASVGKSCIVVRFVRDEFFEFQGKFWSIYALLFFFPTVQRLASTRGT